MEPSTTIQSARLYAGLTQGELAGAAGTSQATVSAYESGAKRPTIATLERLLSATGRRLEVVPRAPRQAGPMAVQGQRLAEVLALAEALPARRRGSLRYPRLTTLSDGNRSSRAS